MLSDAWIWDLSWGLQFHSKFLVRNYFFLKNNLTSEGALSHNVLYYQKLSAARYQVSFCAKKCFEQLQIVSKRKEFQSSLQFVLFVIITGHRHLLQTGWGKKSTIRESAQVCHWKLAAPKKGSIGGSYLNTTSFFRDPASYSILALLTLMGN